MIDSHPNPSDEISDGDLVSRVLGGDQTAFSVLFRRHVGPVTAVCRSRVGGPDVDDVVQETFIKAIERLAQLDDPTAFGGWVRAIAVRGCVDAHRRAGRTVSMDIFEDHLDVQESNDDVLLRRELATEVHATLSSLPARDREALLLRDGHATPIQELAQRFQLSEGSTRVMLSRARTRLRTAYAAAAAWVVGLRAARMIGSRAPQMVAAAVAAVAVPVLLLSPAIRPAPVDGRLPSPAPSLSSTGGDVSIPANGVEGQLRISPAASLSGSGSASGNGANPSSVPANSADHPDAVVGPLTVGTRTADNPDAEFDQTISDGDGEVFGVEVEGGELGDRIDEVVPFDDESDAESEPPSDPDPEPQEDVPGIPFPPPGDACPGC